jgi:WD40 repeat protein
LFNFKNIGDYLISIGNDGHVSVWNTNTLSLVYKKEGNDHPLADAIITDEYHILASNDGTIHLYFMDNDK